MGLDMYLYRATRVDGITAEQYGEIDEAIPDHADATTDIEAATGIAGANALRGDIHAGWTYSADARRILAKVGYWRKANAIHKWFVDRVQEGKDDCQFTFVTADDLRGLLGTVKTALGKKSLAVAGRLLPTQGGFFFGSTAYDDDYRADLENTVKILETVLAETDWERQVVIYHASW